MKVATYARYSSDHQRAASIPDQQRVCREFAVRQGWSVTADYTDAAASGASLMRPGLQALMRASAEYTFDVVLAESLDRFSRDQEDTAGLFKRLTFAGVRIFTVSEGEIGHLHVGLKGTMNALYLHDLAEKTRRGLRGRVEAGRSGGGLCYGYRVVRALEGQPRGARAIHPKEATIVQRLFQASLQEYRQMLPRHSMRTGRGAMGAAWAIDDSRTCQPRNGHLNNGVIGRPSGTAGYQASGAGKRTARLNPPTSDHEGRTELRIIDDALWQAAKDGKRPHVTR